MARKFAKEVLHLLQIIIVFLSKSSIHCKRVKQFERNYIKLPIILKEPSYSRNDGGLLKMSKTFGLRIPLYYWGITMQRGILVLLKFSATSPLGWITPKQLLAGSKHDNAGEMSTELLESLVLRSSGSPFDKRDWLGAKGLSSVVREINAGLLQLIYFNCLIGISAVKTFLLPWRRWTLNKRDVRDPSSSFLRTENEGTEEPRVNACW